eukprot:gene11745-21448_t
MTKLMDDLQDDLEEGGIYEHNRKKLVKLAKAKDTEVMTMLGVLHDSYFDGLGVKGKDADARKKRWKQSAGAAEILAKRTGAHLRDAAARRGGAMETWMQYLIGFVSMMVTVGIVIGHRVQKQIKDREGRVFQIKVFEGLDEDDDKYIPIYLNGEKVVYQHRSGALQVAKVRGDVKFTKERFSLENDVDYMIQFEGEPDKE